MSEFTDQSDLPYSFWRVLIAAALIGATLLAMLVYA
jgi:hypothetical protein